MPHQRSAKDRKAFASASDVCQGSGEPGEWGVSATELPTTFTYTGQREAAEIGLMYYVARWYDSDIGHFIQADTIVPGAGNVIAWNRFGYAVYNPIRYSDPTGHMVDEEGSYNPWKKTVRTTDGVYNLVNHSYLETGDPIADFPIPVKTPAPSKSNLHTPQMLPPTSTPNPFPTPTPTSELVEIPPGQEYVYYPYYILRGGGSIFVELDGGTGGVGSVIGYKFLLTEGQCYLLQYFGEPAGSIEGGASINIGIEFSINEGISNYIGTDYELDATGSIGKFGLSVGLSHDSISIAWAPGAHFGVGTTWTDSTLITDFSSVRDYFKQ